MAPNPVDLLIDNFPNFAISEKVKFWIVWMFDCFDCLIVIEKIAQSQSKFETEFVNDPRLTNRAKWQGKPH